MTPFALSPQVDTMDEVAPAVRQHPGAVVSNLVGGADVADDTATPAVSGNSPADEAPIFCECGCGQPAPIAKRTDSRKGHHYGCPVLEEENRQREAAKEARKEAWKAELEAAKAEEREPDPEPIFGEEFRYERNWYSHELEGARAGVGNSDQADPCATCEDDEADCTECRKGSEPEGEGE